MKAPWILFALLAPRLTLGADDVPEELALPTPDEATFHAHIAPILKKSCLGCHGGERPKSRFSVESYELFLKGGRRRGETVVKGNAAESLVYQMVAGLKKPFMPPKKADPLTSAEIGVFKVWIDGGAKEGKAVAERVPYAEPPVPPTYPRRPVIAALRFTPDGKRLLVTGYREVLVHDLETVLAASDSAVVEPAGRLVGEAERLYALDVSPDGKRLAVAGGSPARFGEVQLWDLENGKLLHFLRLGRDTLFAARFSPDGSKLAVGGTDRAIHLLEVEDFKEIYASEIHADWVFALAFSGDGKRILSAGRDKTLKVCEAVDGKFVQTLATLSGTVTRLLTQPGGDLVLAASESKEAVLYSVKNLKQVRKLEGQPDGVLAAAFNRDGSQLALAGVAKEIRVYSSADGKRVMALPASAAWNFAVAFSPDGKKLAAGGHAGDVYVYDLEARKQVKVFTPVPLATRPAEETTPESASSADGG